MEELGAQTGKDGLLYLGDEDPRKEVARDDIPVLWCTSEDVRTRPFPAEMISGQFGHLVLDLPNLMPLIDLLPYRHWPPTLDEISEHEEIPNRYRRRLEGFVQSFMTPDPDTGQGEYPQDPRNMNQLYSLAELMMALQEGDFQTPGLASWTRMIMNYVRMGDLLGCIRLGADAGQARLSEYVVRMTNYWDRHQRVGGALGDGPTEAYGAFSNPTPVSVEKDGSFVELPPPRDEVGARIGRLLRSNPPPQNSTVLSWWWTQGPAMRDGERPPKASPLEDFSADRSVDVIGTAEDGGACIFAMKLGMARLFFVPGCLPLLGCFAEWQECWRLAAEADKRLWSERERQWREYRDLASVPYLAPRHTEQLKRGGAAAARSRTAGVAMEENRTTPVVVACRELGSPRKDKVTLNVTSATDAQGNPQQRTPAVTIVTFLRFIVTWAASQPEGSGLAYVPRDATTPPKQLRSGQLQDLPGAAIFADTMSNLSSAITRPLKDILGPQRQSCWKPASPPEQRAPVESPVKGGRQIAKWRICRLVDVELDATLLLDAGPEELAQMAELDVKVVAEIIDLCRRAQGDRSPRSAP
jgi:hypothetical protein